MRKDLKMGCCTMHDHRGAPQGPTYSKSSLATVSCRSVLLKGTRIMHADKEGGGTLRKSQDSIKGRKQSRGGITT